MAEPSRAGEVLAGKYELLERLGAGGMGDVWVARHRLLDRRVAIKLLHPELARDTAMVHRLLREARAASGVHHPHIVEVLDVDREPGGAPFIVQELLEGRDLGQYLRELGGGMPAELALRLLVPVVDAIAAAHDKGIIHRDIKPENVFLAQRDGAIVPKVLDFGLAKQAGDVMRLTATDVVMGTPAYMSPEQIARPELLGPPSDVWSLGVLFYETLAGRLPFGAPTMHALLIAITTGTPIPLSEVAPEVPADLARIVMMTLRYDPAERPRDARALLAELATLDEGLRGPLTRPDAPLSQTAETMQAPRPVSSEPAPKPLARPRAPIAAAPAVASRPPPIGADVPTAALTAMARAPQAWADAELETLPRTSEGARPIATPARADVPKRFAAPTPRASAPRAAALEGTAQKRPLARGVHRPAQKKASAPVPLELEHVPRSRPRGGESRARASMLDAADWIDVGLAALIVLLSQLALVATHARSVERMSTAWGASSLWLFVALSIVLGAGAGLGWVRASPGHAGALGATLIVVGLGGLALLAASTGLAPHLPLAARVLALRPDAWSWVAACVPAGLAVAAVRRSREDHARGASAPGMAFGALALLAVAVAFAIGRLGDRAIVLLP